MDLEGQLTYCNAAAERLLGYHAAELVAPWSKAEILAPGEGERLLAEMQKLCRVEQVPRLLRLLAGLPISIACANCRRARCPASKPRYVTRMASPSR